MATMREIARLAGVSAGTVSRIINNDPTLSVSNTTRENVLNIAKEVNYIKPKRITEKRSSLFTMGLVQWYTANEEINDNYYLRARQGVEDFCLKNNIKIIRVFKGDDELTYKLGKVDGLICLGKFSRDEVNRFIELCDNIVFLDMVVDNKRITTLTMDFNNAIYTALNYLCKLGHKEIGFLGGVEFVGDNEKLTDPRTIAYKKYMQHRQMDYTTFFREDSFSIKSGYDMMLDIINSGSLPTAILAASDSIAIGAIKALNENNISVPDNISIIGFNDVEAASYINPPLTTINAPAYDMGQHGCNLVYVASNLSIHTPLKAKIPCKLVIRKSCKAKD